MARTAALIFSLFLIANTFAQESVVEATTASGEKVKLLPNGRWEYADSAKAAPQKKARAQEAERERKSQGGWFGVGRKVYEGDKDYNRGSLGRR